MSFAVYQSSHTACAIFDESNGVTSLSTGAIEDTRLTAFTVVRRIKNVQKPLWTQCFGSSSVYGSKARIMAWVFACEDFPSNGKAM